MGTINYNGMIISFYESQTVGNCIDLGFGTEKIKSIIKDLRSKGFEFMNKKELEKYR